MVYYRVTGGPIIESRYYFLKFIALCYFKSVFEFYFSGFKPWTFYVTLAVFCYFCKDTYQNS